MNKCAFILLALVSCNSSKHCITESNNKINNCENVIVESSEIKKNPHPYLENGLFRKNGKSSIKTEAVLKQIDELENISVQKPYDTLIKNHLAFLYYITDDFYKAWQVLHLAYVIDPPNWQTTYNMISMANMLEKRFKLAEDNVHMKEVWKLIGYPTLVGASDSRPNCMIQQYDEVQFVYDENNRVIAILASEKHPGSRYYTELSKKLAEDHIDDHSSKSLQNPEL